MGESATEVGLSSVRDWFLLRAVKWVPFLSQQFDSVRGCFHPEDWDERYDDCMYALAYLYTKADDRNPYYKDPSLRDMALAAGDYTVARQNSLGEWPHGPGGVFSSVEWPCYYLMETLVLAAEDLSSKQETAWRLAVERFVTNALRRPFSFTSPSQEAWKCAVLARAAQVLERPEWADSARWQMRQLNAQQTSEGFWHEPCKGHGPSISYHHLHLGALGLYCRFLEDPEAAEALTRAIDFASRSSYPDGLGVECADGRSPFTPWSVLCAAPGLWQSPAGRRLLTLAVESLTERTTAPSDPWAEKTWNAFIQPCFLVDAHRYYQAGEAQRLAFESDGYSCTSEGQVAVRRSGWFASLSAWDSDIPLVSENRLAFERQSRFCVWHEDRGLFLGGGSQSRGERVPLTNLFFVTGYQGIGGEFGIFHVGEEAGSLVEARVFNGIYLPRQSRVFSHEVQPSLLLTFAHGEAEIAFRELDASTAEILFQTDFRTVESLFCQLPLVLFHDSRLGIDDADPRSSATRRQAFLNTATVDRSVEVYRPRWDGRIVVERPWDTKAVIHWPLHPGFRFEQDPNFEPLYTVALLSAKVSRPNEKRATVFRIRIERL